MSDFDEYEVDYVELIGYISGIFLAVALIPQVVKSWREKSTQDISFAWQLTYMAGLWLNFTYLYLVGAIAAWVSILFEIFFAHLLFCLKLRFDGCRTPEDPDCARTQTDTVDDETIEDKRMSNHSNNTETTCSTFIEETFGRQRTIHEGGAKNSRGSVDQTGPNAFRTFHFTFDVRFEVPVVPTELGEEVVKQMIAVAKRHGVPTVGKQFRVSDGSCSPSGFASVILLDGGHMTTHCYSDEGILAFDCFTFGSNTEGTRRVASEMVNFFKECLRMTTKVELEHMPRFPEQKTSNDDKHFTDFEEP